MTTHHFDEERERPSAAVGRMARATSPRREVELAKLRLAELADRSTPVTQTMQLAQKYPAYALGGTLIAGLVLMKTGIGRKMLKYSAVWAAQAAGLHFVAQMLTDERGEHPPPR